MSKVFERNLNNKYIEIFMYANNFIGNYLRTIDFFEEYMEFQPGSYNIRLNVVNAYNALGRYKKALEYCDTKKDKLLLIERLHSLVQIDEIIIAQELIRKLIKIGLTNDEKLRVLFLSCEIGVKSKDYINLEKYLIFIENNYLIIGKWLNIRLYILSKYYNQLGNFDKELYYLKKAAKYYPKSDIDTLFKIEAMHKLEKGI